LARGFSSSAVDEDFAGQRCDKTPGPDEFLIRSR
jgi:hypothetical protein